MKSTFFPRSAFRVKISTNHKSNDKIERQMTENVAKYLNANKEDISRRIDELNKEWDTERVLEANASAIIFIGTVLGFLVNGWLFLIGGFISFYLFMHALEGWCPPLPLIRKLGVRTVSILEEILMKSLVTQMNSLKPQKETDIIN